MQIYAVDELAVISRYSSPENMFVQCKQTIFFAFVLLDGKLIILIEPLFKLTNYCDKW